MEIKTVSDFRGAIRQGAYAWPGGYPLFFVAHDGEAISFEAAKAERRQIIWSIGHKINDGWRIVGVEVNWEDTNLVCAHTGKSIECAYDADSEPTHAEKVDGGYFDPRSDLYE